MACYKHARENVDTYDSEQRFDNPRPACYLDIEMNILEQSRSTRFSPDRRPTGSRLVPDEHVKFSVGAVCTDAFFVRLIGLGLFQTTIDAECITEAEKFFGGG